MRLGPGPVFAYEWLTTTRRWQLYALRALFVGLILAGMMFTWQVELSRTGQGQTVSLQQLAEYGERFYSTIVSIELTLVLLAAPAATAGAICLDKARGTLDHMLATDLSNAEIVLGKLGARLVPVLGLIVCVVPILSLAGLLGGIDPLALFGSFSIAIACGVLGCSLALILSVWGRKTHEVLMLTYLILILWVLGPLLWIMVLFSITIIPSLHRFLWDSVILSNPYYLAFAPYSQPGTVGLTTYLVFLAVCLGLSGLLVGLSTLRIRKVALKQAGQPAARSRRWSVHSPSLRGRHGSRTCQVHRSTATRSCGASGIARRPTRFLRLVWVLYGGPGCALDCAVAANRTPWRLELRRIHRRHERVSGRGGIVAPERDRRHQPGRGAGARQPRCPAFHSLIDAFDPGREMVGGLPAGSFPVDLAGLDDQFPGRWRAGDWIQYVLLLGLIAAYGAVHRQPGTGIGNLGEPAGTRGRALRHCLCSVLDRLGGAARSPVWGSP